jgi:GNAT superfamily N-acetyltransferase
MHMDCLFVRAAHRNQNIGTRLMLEVLREAQRRGIAQLQWQTPLWNVGADRFYRRLGVQPSEKYRYTLAVEDQACSWPASLALEGSRG